MGALASLLCLQRMRCTSKCGWRGVRFSRSQLHRRKRRLKTTLFVVLFIVIAAVTVRYALSRYGSRPSEPRDEGIREVD
jgi:hypothetical protein